MKNIALFASLLLGLFTWNGCEKADAPPARRSSKAPPVSSSSSSLSLVRGGRATSVLVLADNADATLRATADYFVRVVAKSTGAEIPIVSPEEESALPAETARLFVGPSAKALAAGLDLHAMEPETYRIVTRDNALFILGRQPDSPEIKGNPGVNSRPTLWAFNHLLETQLGVRWLWPGELGTFVPRHRDFEVPPSDITYQPKLELRSLRLLLSTRRPLASTNPEIDRRLREEAILWAENHQNGGRGEIRFGHNFTNWWSRFSETHPDYFAELPPGLSQPFPKPAAVKLRLSNPAVIEQIASDYEAAGKPKYWNVCPNDGSGFDISEGTRAWDVPQDQPISDIVSARGDLTARYVHFWNLLYERLRQINPDVTLISYAYSCYRNAPSPDRPLTAKAVLQIVDTLDAYENWKGWSSMGADLFLRPNWWHQGADAPYLSLEKTEKFIKFAWENRMLGLDMDSILGYWATQGPNYYLVARLMTRPDLTKEDILTEYTSAFGKAAPKIREYLNYWEELSNQYNYAMNATGSRVEKESKFEDLVRAGKIPRSTLNGSKYALPYLYPDEVLAPALEILDKAGALVANGDEEAMRRIDFLRKGLDSLKATRAQILLGQEVKEQLSPEALARFTQGAIELDRIREKLSLDHVVWSEGAKQYENRYHILLRPSALEFNKINLDGM